MGFPGSLERLIAELKKLPGVGEKTATRYVLHWLGRGPEALETLAAHLLEAAKTVRPCSKCGFLAEADLCRFCSDPAREQDTICVVETTADVLAVEKVGEYRGLYHVLGGAISALRGLSPEQLRIAPLLRRVSAGGVREVILATGADAEGETTALYLHKVLKDTGVQITRPATGIPIGQSIEYLDAVTLLRAFRARKEIGA